MKNRFSIAIGILAFSASILLIFSGAPVDVNLIFLVAWLPFLLCALAVHWSNIEPLAKRAFVLAAVLVPGSIISVYASSRFVGKLELGWAPVIATLLAWIVIMGAIAWISSTLEKKLGWDNAGSQ